MAACNDCDVRWKTTTPRDPCWICGRHTTVTGVPIEERVTTDA